MSFTNLCLGYNWASDEWPEYIYVSHTILDGHKNMRYVPEKTCKFIHRNNDIYPSCSSCGYIAGYLECCVSENNVYEYTNNYCPQCGSHVGK